jgi:hypothetical protein
MPRRGRQIEEFDFKVRTFRGEHWIAAVHVSGPVIFKGYLRLELKGSREDADEAAAAIRKRIRGLSFTPEPRLAARQHSEEAAARELSCFAPYQRLSARQQGDGHSHN